MLVQAVSVLEDSIARGTIPPMLLAIVALEAVFTSEKLQILGQNSSNKVSIREGPCDTCCSTSVHLRSAPPDRLHRRRARRMAYSNSGHDFGHNVASKSFGLKTRYRNRRSSNRGCRSS